MTSFLELLGNFPYRGLPPLYLRKYARFLGQCTALCPFYGPSPFYGPLVPSKALCTLYCTLSPLRPSVPSVSSTALCFLYNPLSPLPSLPHLSLLCLLLRVSSLPLPLYLVRKAQ
jgi:hypothetical protein